MSELILDVGDEFRSLYALLAASVELDHREEKEHELAVDLVDTALNRIRNVQAALRASGKPLFCKVGKGLHHDQQC